MATGSVSSLGVGSGLDANTIVSKLMAASQAPLQTLQAREAAFNTKLSSYGLLQSALSALQTAAKALADPTRLGGFTVSAADGAIVGGQANSFAVAGSYTIEVLNLASAQKRYSATAYASGETFGSGTLRFNINGVDKEVQLTGDSNSLADIRAAINGANIGVTAAVISGDGGDRLVLTGTATGSAGAFTMTVDSADAKLQSLANFDLSHPFNSEAQDARALIDGELVTSSSNTLNSALSGLTLTLNKTGSTTLTVGKDSSKALEAVNAFVKAYNDVMNRITTDAAWDSKTQTGKPLNAESTVRSVTQMLNNARNGVPSALAGTPFETLSALGISVQSSGLLTVDETKFKDAVLSSFTDVQRTLGAFGQVFSDTVDSLNGTDGLVTNRVAGIKNSIKLNQDDQAKMQMRLDAIEQRYRAQFTALDTLMGTLTTTSSYLTQQLAALNNNK